MNWGVNMDKVYIGKIVSTHGIKGEIKIISDFPYKEKVFRIDNEIIIDDLKYIIKSYRVHKNFDMVTLNDYKDINEVLFLMKKKVYINKEKLELNDNEILDEDLITYEVLTNQGKKGIIKEIFLASSTNKIIRVEIEGKEILIPINSPFIKEIDKNKKIVIIEIINGM